MQRMVYTLHQIALFVTIIATAVTLYMLLSRKQ